MDQHEVNQMLSNKITSLEARFDHHDNILDELKDGAREMVKAINQVKYVLIVLAIGMLLNAGPLQSVLLKVLVTH